MPRRTLRPGDGVRIRGERWRVIAVSAYEAASIVDVDGCDAANRGTKARFVLPFEPMEPLRTGRPWPQTVGIPAWRRTARATLAGAVPEWTSLRAAARGHFSIIPFQLEPALALTRGDGCRFLIADDVGLGKTIQAGLIVAETVTRTPDAHVLIVSPAGLREQWRHELESRFALKALIFDAAGIARVTAQLSPDVNPWSVAPIVITSIDYVKRPEVVRSLEAQLWDVVVFDEAHALSGRSDRATVAAGLAERARCVVMLTATPHSGDDDGFARLRSLGDLNGEFPLVMFRRTRAAIGLPHRRRSVFLRVRPALAEMAMHRGLDEYARLISSQQIDSITRHAVALVIGILNRRARSSAGSLARSLQRRIAWLAENPVPLGGQFALPFNDSGGDEEPAAELGVAGLSNASEERVWLDRLLVLARAASLHESKARVLRRLLRRANEPALVFTEYRDTLQHLATALSDFEPLELHGGLTSSDRRRVLRQFTEGRGRLLLATDAASEGLNLHHRCRLVVNLELPWTPVRLEQRIGRVDRLGQTRRVHAVHLLLSNSGETEAASGFAGRAARIDSALDQGRDVLPRLVDTLRPIAESEAARLEAARRLAVDEGTIRGRPFFTVAARGGKPQGVTWALRIPFIDSAGHLVFDTIIGLQDRRGRLSFDDALMQLAAFHQERILEKLTGHIRPSRALMVRREQAIGSAVRLRHARLSKALQQSGLFDRRGEHAVAAQAQIVTEALERSAARLAAFERLAGLRADVAAVVFGIAFR